MDGMDGIGSLCGAILWPSLCDANNVKDIGHNNTGKEFFLYAVCTPIVRC